jgi:protein-tyrosine phosphatase
MSADIYWIPDVPGGRLAILGRPRASDWLSDEITDWNAAGVTDVVSLLQSHEVRELGLTQEADIVEQPGLSFEEFPIPDRGVPESVEAAHALWARIETKIRNGQAVGVHCRASIGRAGLVTAGVLMRLGSPEGEAWRRASAARGRPLPDTDEQRLWVASAFRRDPSTTITP